MVTLSSLALAAILAAQPGPPGGGPRPGPGPGGPGAGPGGPGKGPPFGPGGGGPGGGLKGPGGGGPGGSMFGPPSGGPPRMSPPGGMKLFPGKGAGGPPSGPLKGLQGKLGPDFAKAKTPGDKAALSKKLTDVGQGTKNDPVTQFTAFQEAIRTGIESGDVSAVFGAIESACKIFNLDEHAEKAQILKEMFAGSSGEGSEQLYSGASEAAQRAAAYDDYENAREIASDAYNYADKNNDSEEKEELAELKQYLQAAAQQLQSALAAEKTLATKPDDTASNLSIGRYLALVKQEWDKGLPYLAKGGDGALPLTARDDLSAAKDPAKQQAMGDAWWAASADEQGKHEADSMKRRAGYWYAKSLAGLSGPTRAKVEKRLAEVKALGR